MEAITGASWFSSGSGRGGDFRQKLSRIRENDSEGVRRRRTAARDARGHDREVFNGDLGTVGRVDEDEGVLVAEFEGREVAYPFGELDTLVLAYATTIHKSQGSQYPAVVIPVVTQHYAMLARNLLYTGVMRGKRLVVFVGQRKAIGIAVRGGQMRTRWTKLREWLKEVVGDIR